MTPEIRGHADEGYGPLADAFARNFAEAGERGAAVAVHRDGRLVVDLWAGTDGFGRPWRAESAPTVFSVTKALVAISVHMAAERGLLDFDAPVAEVWPEYARHGKEATTLRHIMSHRAGVPGLDAVLTPADAAAWHPFVRAIEDQRPLWEPGTAYLYHPLTFGWLAGEPLRRATGMTPGRFIAAEIAGPLGADAWLGLPADRRDRLARVDPPPGKIGPDPSDPGDAFAERALRFGKLFPRGLFGEPGGVNDPEALAIEVPGGGAVATASALARILAATVTTVDGVRLMGDEAVRDALVLRSQGRCWDGTEGPNFSTGFKLDKPNGRRLLSAASFGHDGACGELAFADADAKLGFGYVNGSGQAEDTRAERLVFALRECLG
ncbi:serine hydrolase domain-containing protein [Glycomyces paridis]|uniref:Beta-lactamase family protein n=1 Tax=Glycomyces paridis TaxID=2126555 RepID=A0A4S8P6P4_9ACTN|nr:serine hydrolase domain-containing protein [Glycomyces paridis]THV23449.1 beta-lactamase family protein [Glycomyces paridis]